MGKIENLEKYITKCDEFIKDKLLFEEQEKNDFFMEVESVYGEEIKGFRAGLDFYEPCYGNQEAIDFDGDIRKIKAKLINYKDNLELEEQKRKDELELARLKQGNINVSANANNSNNININITLDQAIENINQIPDDIMTKDEKEDLEDKLSGIDAAVRSGKKEKVKEKICGVLKFLADKGADALIVMLPYLGQIAGMISQV